MKEFPDVPHADETHGKQAMYCCTIQCNGKKYIGKADKVEAWFDLDGTEKWTKKDISIELRALGPVPKPTGEPVLIDENGVQWWYAKATAPHGTIPAKASFSEEAGGKCLYTFGGEVHEAAAFEYMCLL